MARKNRSAQSVRARPDAPRSTRHSKSGTPNAGRFFQNLVEGIGDGIAVVNADGLVAYCSPQVEHLLEAGPGGLLGRNCLEFVDPLDLHTTTEAFHQLVERPDATVTLDLRLQCADGTGRYVQLFARNFLNDPTLSGIEVSIRDASEHQRAIDELVRTETLFNTIVENSLDAMVILDGEGNFTYSSPSYERILGFRPNERVGGSLYERIHPDDVQSVATAFGQFIEQQGAPLHAEVRARHKDGSWRHIEAVGVNLLDHPSVRGIVVTLRDVSETRRAEQGLQRSKEKLRLYLDSSPDAIYINDADGTLLYGNAAAERLTGHSREKLVGKTFLEAGLLAPESVPKALEVGQANLKGTPSGPDEFEIMNKAGNRIPVEICTYPIAQGDSLEVIGIARDITERKRASEELQKREEQFRALIENASDLTVTIGADGTVLYESPSVARLLGYNPEERMGKSAFEHVHPDDLPGVEQAFASIRRQAGAMMTMELRLMRKDGSWSHLEGIGRNLLDVPAVQGIIVNLHDITERKMAEQVVQRNLELEKTVSNIASRFIGGFSTDEATDAALADVGVACGASRSYVFLLSEDGSTMSNTHEWCAEGISAEKHNLQDIPCETFPWWMRRLRKWDVIRIRDVSKLGKRAAAEKRILEQQGIKSLLVLPIRVGEELGGFIGFDNIMRTGGWSEDDLLLLLVVSGIIGSAIRRRRAEKALKESEEKFKRLVEDMNDGYLVVQDSKVVFANTASAQMLGCSAEEVLGSNIKSFLSPDLFRRFSRVSARRRRGEPVPDQHETELQKKDGSKCYVELSTRGTTYLGRPAVSIVARDITQRRQVEEALRRSEKNYRVLFNSTLDGLCVIDSETFRIAFGNEPAARIFGFDSVEEAIGLDPLDLIPEQDRDFVRRLIAEEVLQKDLHETYELQGLTRDNRQIWFSAVGTRIEFQGRVASLVSIRDITEQKRIEDAKQDIEEQLQLAGRLAAVGELAAGVAHELNNPLAAVQAFAQLLASRDDLQDSMRKDVDTILKEAKRASKITGNLLSFARKHKPEKTMVSINDIIEKSLELHAYRLKVNNIKVSLDLGRDLAMTMADFHQLQQVFANIITNAEQAMMDANGKGTLRIKTRKVGDMLQATFTDDGPGISVEDQKRIFDPFFTTKGVGKGTGLGLSICFGIVEGHGGRMYVKNKPGEGATFVVEIPITYETEATDEPDQPTNQGEKANV